MCDRLDYVSDRGAGIAAVWQVQATDDKSITAREIFRAVFESADHFGPRQFVEFHHAADPEARAIQAQRAEPNYREPKAQVSLKAAVGKYLAVREDTTPTRFTL